MPRLRRLRRLVGTAIDSEPPDDAFAAAPTFSGSTSSSSASFFAFAAAGCAPSPGLSLVATSPLTDASSIWATSRTSTSARAEPLSWASVRPSASITRQNGQPTAIWSAPVATASFVRLTLIRSPMVSSIHIRAPPAPQQNDRSPLRSISASSAPGMICSRSRGGV